MKLENNMTSEVLKFTNIMELLSAFKQKRSETKEVNSGFHFLISCCRLKPNKYKHYLNENKG